MNQRFIHILAGLRREKGVSQRQAAQDLGVSQALLSHYENGIREPGLAFVVRACDYYGVPADYLLGRSEQRQGRQPADRAAELDRAAAILADACVQAAQEDPDLAELFRMTAEQVLQTLEKAP